MRPRTLRNTPHHTEKLRIRGPENRILHNRSDVDRGNTKIVTRDFDSRSPNGWNWQEYGHLTPPAGEDTPFHTSAELVNNHLE